MIKRIKTYELEERFFAIVLISSIPYLIINIMITFAFQKENPLLIIYFGLLLLSIGTLYYLSKAGSSTLAINFFTLAVLAALIYYIPRTVGPTGGMSYAIQTVIIVLVLITRGTMHTVVVIVMSAIVLVFFSDILPLEGPIKYGQLIIDYCVNLLFTSIFILLFKYNFDAERKELTHKNYELKLLNQELESQSLQLEAANAEIQSIRDNLQEKIIERTKILEEENKNLLDYSFINAHLVRAPITNIMGLADLDEKKLKTKEIKEIKQHVLEMDDVVRRIARVLKYDSK